MPKLLLMQTGKDAEMENTLIERDESATSPTRQRNDEIASNAPASIILSNQGKTLRVDGSTEENVSLAMQDAEGHSMKLNLPLDPALFQARSQAGHTLKAASAGTLFSALVSELAAAPMPLLAGGNGGAEEEAGGGTKKHQTWSLDDEASAFQHETERAVLIIKGVLLLARRGPADTLTRLRLEPTLNRIVREHKSAHPERTFTVNQRSRHLALAYPDCVDVALSLLIENAEVHTPPELPLAIDSFDGSKGCYIALLDKSGDDQIEHVLGAWDLSAEAPQGAQEQDDGGIGLSIGRQLVESMNGELWYGRRKQGGSAFVVSLPFARRPRHEEKIIQLPRKFGRSNKDLRALASSRRYR